MIPILDCGYSHFKWVLKSIKRERDNHGYKKANSNYKGNLKRKKKRESEEKTD